MVILLMNAINAPRVRRSKSTGDPPSGNNPNGYPPFFLHFFVFRWCVSLRRMQNIVDFSLVWLSDKNRVHATVPHMCMYVMVHFLDGHSSCVSKVLWYSVDDESRDIYPLQKAGDHFSAIPRKRRWKHRFLFATILKIYRV